MNKTEKRIQKEVNKHRWELVYEYPFEVYMLVGWTKQYDEDYFYIVWERDKGIILVTCVMDFIFLKDRLTKKEYDKAEKAWYMNELDKKAMVLSCKQKKLKVE